MTLRTIYVYMDTDVEKVRGRAGSARGVASKSNPAMFIENCDNPAHLRFRVLLDVHTQDMKLRWRCTCKCYRL